MSASRKKPTKADLHERDVRAALAWPDVEKPAALTSEECERLVRESPTGLVRAWTYNVARRDVVLGAFDGHNHRPDGPMGKGHFASRGQGGPWFSTREDACLALRADATREAANMLHGLDARIMNMLAAELPEEAPDAEAMTASPRP